MIETSKDTTLKREHLWIWILLVTLLPGCQHHVRSSSESTHSPVQSGVEKVLPTAYFPTYHLQSGDELEVFYHIDVVEVPKYGLNINDVVELNFFDLPELSTEQVIRPDGRITAPLLGAVHVLGLTPEQASVKLREAYIGTLKEPNLYLVLKDFGTRIEEARRALSNASNAQSRDIRIGPDGTAVFPIVGTVPLGGMTLARANQVISRLYHQKQMELQVELALKRTANQLIYVLGEVQKPGAYGINRPLGVGQVLALAGGTTDQARLAEIVLVRRNGSETTARKLDYQTEIQGDWHGSTVMTAQSYRGAPILLQPDDILYIPKRALASAAQVAREIRDLMMFRGFSIGSIGLNL